LSAELSRGERAVGGLDGIERAIGPALARLGEAFKPKKKADDETAGEDDLATPL
jgi:hypothetical protein